MGRLVDWKITRMRESLIALAFVLATGEREAVIAATLLRQ
jgi:hypothetical protein